MRQPVYLHPLHEDDYERLMTLWELAGGILLNETDNPEALSRILKRNPGCCYGAFAGTRLVGSILAGHDGWRGYLYHLAVKPKYREKRVAFKLVKAALSAIKMDGIPKVHCLVRQDNLIAQQFWSSYGFVQRDDLFDYSWTN